MPYRKDSNTGQTGTAPNQSAQVGMGGSLGGGQFEQGEGQSGSLQSEQGGTDAREEAFGSDTDGTVSRGRDADQGEAAPRRKDGMAREDDSGGPNV